MSDKGKPPSAPVEVTNEDPLPVTLMKNGKDAKPVVTKDGSLSLPPNTTEQEDIVTAGQRHVSLLWESVQGAISVSVTMAVIYCQIRGIQSETLNNAFFFVIATYLQRTNHTRVGGSDSGKYMGR